MILRRAGVAVALVTLWAASAADAQRSRTGVFVRTAEGQFELRAYAEPLQTGRLRMARGDLDQAPLIHELEVVLASLPNWRPQGVFVATTALFRDERAERRLLPIATHMTSVFATEVRVADLERRDRIAELLRSIEASADSPGYAFVMMSLGGVQRYYPIRLTPRER